MTTDIRLRIQRQIKIRQVVVGKFGLAECRGAEMVAKAGIELPMNQIEEFCRIFGVEEFSLFGSVAVVRFVAIFINVSYRLSFPTNEVRTCPRD